MFLPGWRKKLHGPTLSSLFPSCGFPCLSTTSLITQYCPFHRTLIVSSDTTSCVPKNLVVTFSYNAQTSQNYVHIKALYMKINNKFIIFDNMLIWLSHAHYITHHTNLWKIMICLHSSQQPLLPSYPKPQHNPENSIMSFFLNEFFPPSKVH